MTVFCFGDSWAYGSELNQPQIIEHPFVHWFSTELSMPYKNYGEEGASLGIILHRIVKAIPTITKDDIVLVIIPPDCRWYDESEEKGFYTLMQWMEDDYKKSLNNKSIEWFKYHHALFIYTIQQLLNDIGCYYLMAHNYGDHPKYLKYDFQINYDKFLDSYYDLTNLLSDRYHKWRSYQLETDGPMYSHEFLGDFFKGKVCHPNEEGHKHIAKLFLDRYKNDTVSTH